MDKTTLPDFEGIFVKRPGSIGQYVYDDCPTCAIDGKAHTIMICRVCGAPPVHNGCICDVENESIKIKDNK